MNRIDEGREKGCQRLAEAVAVGMGSSMFAGMLAIGLLQNIHLRATASLPTRYARPVRHLMTR